MRLIMLFQAVISIVVVGSRVFGNNEIYDGRSRNALLSRLHVR
jgi:hypothetical protein